MARKEQKAPMLRAADLHAYAMANLAVMFAAKEAISALSGFDAEGVQGAKDNPELTALLEVKRRNAIAGLQRALDSFEGNE